MVCPVPLKLKIQCHYCDPFIVDASNQLPEHNTCTCSLYKEQSRTLLYIILIIIVAYRCETWTESCHCKQFLKKNVFIIVTIPVICQRHCSCGTTPHLDVQCIYKGVGLPRKGNKSIEYLHGQPCRRCVAQPARKGEQIGPF